jgi:hypothetical protein
MMDASEATKAHSSVNLTLVTRLLRPTGETISEILAVRERKREEERERRGHERQKKQYEEETGSERERERGRERVSERGERAERGGGRETKVPLNLLIVEVFRSIHST